MRGLRSQFYTFLGIQTINTMPDFNPTTRKLTLTGTPYEMALQKGVALKDRFDLVLQDVMRAPFLPKWLQRLVPKFAYRAFLKRVGKKYFALHAPCLKSLRGQNLLPALAGLAEGFAVDRELLYGLNAVEILTSEMSFSLGCTSLAFGAAHTQSGQPKIAYNHDFPESFAPHLYVQENLPTTGHASLSLTYPTILGCIAGVNACGLAVSLNHAFATDIKDKPAVPITLLVQECLNGCESVAMAIELILQTEVPNGSMITLADSSGGRACVEVSATKKSVRHATSEILYTFNAYQQPDMLAVEVPLTARAAGMTKWVLQDRLIHEHNIQRKARYLELLKPTHRYSDDDIHALISDHSGTSGSYVTLCRHDVTSMSTIASAIVSPVERTLQVIYGKACEGKYLDYGNVTPSKA